jgi:hypothetical protein
MFDAAAERAVLGSCLLGKLEIVAAVRAALPPDPFYVASHGAIWRAVCALADDGVAPDQVTVPARVKAAGDRWSEPQDTLYVHDLYEAAPLVANPAHARQVADWVRIRRIWEAGTRITQQAAAVAEMGADVDHALDRLVTQVQGDMATLSVASHDPEPVSPHPVELDAFLSGDDPAYDWVIPGLLERGDRVILTGGEGQGKSTLLRQIAVQAASGIHPFGGAEFPPLRVLLLDMENTYRQLRREFRGLRLAAGSRYGGGLFIEICSGLNLGDRQDGDRLLDIVKNRDPDILVTGPSYKMVAGPPTEEGPAAIVAAYLDRIRHDHGCAIVLEAHTPHASNGGRRPKRPYGASLWLRWPEFGVFLGAKGELDHWRGQRDEREWPDALQRGGDWPFTMMSDTYEALWLRIVSACDDAGKKLSERDLATRLHTSKSRIHRAIEEHRQSFELLPTAAAQGKLFPDEASQDVEEEREWYP